MSADLGSREALRELNQMTPGAQAAVLLKCAQTARLLHLAQEGEARGGHLARDLEIALNHAMDADPGPQAELAAADLTDVLKRSRLAGLALRAEVSAIEVDGVLGQCRLPLLSAVLTPLALAA